MVVGDVQVRGTFSDFNNRTSTLVIEAGVSVLFGPRTGLFIGDDTTFDGHNGTLQATGATFTSNRTAPAAGDWKGLRLAVDGGTNTLLDGCTVEWAGRSAALAALVVNQSAVRGSSITAACLGPRPTPQKSERGHAGTVEALLEGGADVNGPGAGALLTPLLAAIEGLQPALVRVLLQAGADVDAGTREETALSLAVANGSREIVELFLAAGADPKRKAPESPSPLEIARLSGYADLVERLALALRG